MPRSVAIAEPSTCGLSANVERRFWGSRGRDPELEPAASTCCATAWSRKHRRVQMREMQGSVQFCELELNRAYLQYSIGQAIRC